MNIYIYIYIHIYIHRYKSKKKNRLSGKRSIFVSLISESKTHILYRFITHRVKYFKLLFIEVLMIVALDNKTPTFSVSENFNIT